MSMFDDTSKASIVAFARKLQGQTLREACGKEIEEHGYKGKGNFGQILEKFYFGYEPNSKAEPDFPKAGIELKSSSLKVLKNGEFRAKERVVLNIINYLDVHKENFETSGFWKKNSHLLFVFYLHSRDIDLLDYLIKLVDGWEYPEGDLKIIRQDWELINQKIKNGKAHELSEGDTFYLGACTKGASAKKSLRDQPFNDEKAKQRAYSLKQGYVNHIIASVAKGKTAVYGKLLEQPEAISANLSIEEIVALRFKPFYGLNVDDILDKLDVKLNKKAKNFFANVTKAILGFRHDQKIEEFEKADVQIKTVRLAENGLPKEHISFPSFKYRKLIETDWEDSDFKSILESKFFFVFYQFVGKTLILKKVKFWNMPHADILEAKQVWDNTIMKVKNGEIVKSIAKNGRRTTHFPKGAKHRISHVRQHGRNKDDTYELPIPDKKTGVTEYSKHCFWLNRSYVKEEVYLK